MTDRVWLVRHASTAWSGQRWCGRTDLPLSAAGRAEAVLLASRLVVVLPTTVTLVSSPALRARETAAPIAQATGLQVEVDDALREVDFGRAEGCTWDEMRRRLPALAAALAASETEIDWPDGETAQAFRQRTEAMWRRVSAGDRSVVLVSHGGIIRSLLAGPVASPAPALIAPASVIELARTGVGWAIASTSEAAKEDRFE
jgi:broad specificity phosphatase PhoE